MEKQNSQTQGSLKKESEILRNYSLPFIKGTDCYEKNYTAVKRDEELAQTKKDFLSVISHELASPLTAIVGYSQMLGVKEMDDDSQEYLESIKESANHLLSLFNAYLCSCEEGSGLAQKMEPFSLRKLFCFIRRYSKITIELKGKNIELKKGFMDSIEDYVISDKGKIQQIFINLINNAIKFTDNGFIEIGARLKNTSTLEFYVADTGRGIPDKQQLEIFERYYQDNTSATGGGRGLGLTISKELVESMGGEIKVQSYQYEFRNEYSGERINTVFLFTVPYEPASKEA